MALTARQIAQMTNCSVSTVSRVLNNSGSVGDEHRKAIRQVIEQHGEVPRVLGPRRNRQMRSEPEATRGGLIDVVMVIRSGYEKVDATRNGVVLASATQSDPGEFFAADNRHANSFYRTIIEGIIDEAQRFGHRVIVQTTDHLPGTVVCASETDRLDSRGMIVLGQACDGLEEFLDGKGGPIVSLISGGARNKRDYVGIDNVEGISAAFAHLRGLGHTKIGYVSGHSNSQGFRERFSAYRLNVSDAGLPYRPEWVVSGTANIGELTQPLVEVLRRPDRPTAMMCCYEGAALAIQRAANEVGLRIPEDLSVVGFDDGDLAQLFTPALTTVRVPVTQIGHNAVQLLMMRQQTGRPTTGASSLRVIPSLIVRQSTASPSVG